MDVGQKLLVSVCWLLVQDCCTVKVTYFCLLQTVGSAYSTTLPSSTNSPIIDLTTPIIVVTDLSLLLFFLLDGKWDWGKSIKSVFVTYRMKGDFVTASQLLLYVNWKTTTAVVRGYKKTLKSQVEGGGWLWLLIDIFLDFWQHWRHPYINYDVNRLLSVWLLMTDTYFLNMALKNSSCYCDRKGKLRFQFWALTFALIYQMCNEKQFLSSWPKSTFSPLHEVLFCNCCVFPDKQSYC